MRLYGLGLVIDGIVVPNYPHPYPVTYIMLSQKDGVEAPTRYAYLPAGWDK